MTDTYADPGYVTTGNEQAWSTTEFSFEDYAEVHFPGQFAFPGPKEEFDADSENKRGWTTGKLGFIAHNDVDVEVDGAPGDTKYVGSYIGPVEPTTVDAHNFTGAQAIVRRLPDTNYGPVATSDHNSLLSILYAMQESNAFYPNETSQIDLVKSV